MPQTPSLGQSLLLALPDPCLQAVLQCCAADQRSLFSAARAHSRLHQAVLLVLQRSFQGFVPQQQLLNSVLAYIHKRGRQIDSLDLRAVHSVTLRQLPSILQLSSLQLKSFSLQLQPDVYGSRGVLGAAAGVAALKQLRIVECLLCDRMEAVATALQQLPAGLQHLCISGVQWEEQHFAGHFARPVAGPPEREWVRFPMRVVQRLQHLIYLELSAVNSREKLQPALRTLTGLIDLRLDRVAVKPPPPRGFVFINVSITASMLSGTCSLTRLQLNKCCVEAEVLAGKTLLQHLELHQCKADNGSEGVAITQLMSHLQPLQQLTYLSLQDSLRWERLGNPPLSVYAALTASSKLQHLGIRKCGLPAGVWQHVFLASRQLPHLTSLESHTGQMVATQCH
jgi:hypothetical protein